MTRAAVSLSAATPAAAAAVNDTMLNLRLIAGLTLMGAAAAATTYTTLPVFSPFTGAPVYQDEAAVQDEAAAVAEMMPKGTKYHEMLMQGVGEWEGEMTMHTPGMEMTERATDTIEAIGPFHTRSIFKASFMGMDFIGGGSMSYDPATEKFISVWTDSFTPAPAIMHGTANDDMTEIEMKWEAADMTGQMAPHRSVTTHTKDMYVMKMYMGEGDAEMHQMTITMKRKK